MRRVRAFTLLELLLVISFVGIAFASVGGALPKALKKKQFEKSVQTLKEEIYFAYEVMLDQKVDVLLHIQKEREGISLTLKRVGEEKARRTCFLKGVQSVHFEKSAFPTLFFDGTTGETPKGSLVIESKKERSSLYLKGFPSEVCREKNSTKRTFHVPYPQERIFPT